MFGLPHDWKVSLEEKEMSVSSKPISNEKSTETELARGRAAAGLDGKSAHEEIRRRAYEIYSGRGGQPGGEIDDWLQAEREQSAVGRAGHLDTEHVQHMDELIPLNLRSRCSVNYGLSKKR